MTNPNDVSLPPGVALADVCAALRGAGARFAYLHGSRVMGTHRADADLDVAGWFGRAVGSWEVSLGTGVDLLVLDTAGMELSGRVAQHGVLLFDDDPPKRVRWQAETSKRFLDEAFRRRRLVDTVFGDG